MGKILYIKSMKGTADFGDEVKRVISMLPSESFLLIIKQTGFFKFVLPVFFSIGEPLKSEGAYRSNSDVFQLSAVNVVVGGVINTNGGPVTLHMGSGPLQSDAYYNLNNALEKPKLVRRLVLINNGMTSFPVEVLGLNKLEFLDLERNFIAELPDGIEQLSALQELYLFDNKLETLPKSFEKLKKMRALGLAFNQFKSFPEEIFVLEKLEILDLSNNQLSTIPATIGWLRNLKVLVLQNNNITNIPPALYTLKRLEKIFLQGNPIDSTDMELLKTTFKKAEIIF